MQRTEQVWLPELQVWAAKCSLPASEQHRPSSDSSSSSQLRVPPGTSLPARRRSPGGREKVASAVAGPRGQVIIDVTSPSCSPQTSSPTSTLQIPSCPICEFSVLVSCVKVPSGLSLQDHTDLDPVQVFLISRTPLTRPWGFLACMSFARRAWAHGLTGIAHALFAR